MRIRNLLMLVCLLCSAYAMAQGGSSRYWRLHATDTISTVTKAYMDSLTVARARIDSVFSANADSLGVDMDGRFYRMFVPLTFYHDVASRAFNIDSACGASEEDKELMAVYLRRPDLVLATQSQLDSSGRIIAPEPEPVTPGADIIDFGTPAPADDNISTPINIYIQKPNFWTFSGDYSLQLFQNYVSSNWYKGGESNYSGLCTVTLQANYNNKQRFRWDNKLEMRLGLQNSRGDTLHSVRASEDLLRYTGKIGLQATKRWYYTFQLIASTQFMRGLKSNDRTVYSAFLSPLTVNPSVGMDYNVNWLKGKLTGSVHLAPIAYTYTYVRKKEMASRYGIDDGKRTKQDFGSEITADLSWQITKDVRWKSRLYGYTTYKRMLMEWENTFTFVVNKYISSNVFIYPRFDDGAARDKDYGYWQLKEYVSLGFNYSF